MKLHDDVHNYYEKLTLDHLSELELDKNHDTEYLADLCCIALNQLPCKYIRYEVDMAFYLPQTERFEMVTRVREAVKRARAYLDSSDNKTHSMQPQNEGNSESNSESGQPLDNTAESAPQDHV